MSFACSDCGESFQDHWRDPGNAGLCRTCAARNAGGCVWPDHPEHLDQQPCSYGTEAPGDPCRYCGEATPMDGSACPACWQPMTIPMFKAWMAAEGLDTTLTKENL